MFENLSDRLERSFKILKGEGKITEINVAETLKDVRRALLDADVNYKVAKTFTDTVKQKALGMNVLTAVKPGQLMVKIVHDELAELMGGESVGLNLANRPAIILMSGLQGSGKTTLTLSVIAQAQKVGKTCAFIDAEHALDPIYAAKLGVDVKELLVSQPDNGEQALEICDALVRSGAVDVVIVDSVAALTPKAEIEGEMGDSHMGLQARLMSQALRKLTGQINKANTIALFINQLREKVGVMFGSPEVTTGGRALKFYSTVRIDVRKGEAIKGADSEILGNRTKIKIVKNKVAPPFKVAEVDIMFGEGISHSGEIIDLGAELGIIKKSGSWFSYNDTKIAQGRDAAKQVILDNPELAEELEGLIFEELKKEK